MGDTSKGCPKLPWMIDFQCTAQDKIPSSQLQAAYANNFLNHLSELTEKSETPHNRLTALLCTIGPSCDTEETLQQMMEAGMTAIRMKMSDYEQEQARDIIRMIRKGSDMYSKKIGRVYPVTIILEIKGPEIRAGSFSQPEIREVQLTEGHNIQITIDPAYKEHITEDLIYIDYYDAPHVIEPYDQICLGNGDARLLVNEIDRFGRIHCTVMEPGKLTNNAVVRISGVPINLPEISEKDKADVKFAVEQNVDALIMCGLKRVDPLKHVKGLLGDNGKSTLLIAKIENSQAVDHFEDILKKADAIFIDGGALSTQFQPEKLFLIRKSLIAKCNKVGKPVICGTQVLETLLSLKHPSTPEVSDIANSILDGADCIILSHETSVGEHPIHAITTLDTICREAEAAVYQKQVFYDLTVETPVEPIYALAISVTEASLKCNAAAIILITTSGRSAKIIAQYRPRCPIIAITRYGHVARKLHIYRGVDPILYIKPLKANWEKDVEERIQLGITWGKVTGLVKAGDVIIIVNGSRPGSGFTNCMRIFYASEYDALVV